LERKLDNLDDTVWNLKKKVYNNVIFDYFWGIVKRVAKSVGWKMTVRSYYDSVSSYYPNKNSNAVVSELNASGQSYNDIKRLKYPFKK